MSFGKVRKMAGQGLATVSLLPTEDFVSVDISRAQWLRNINHIQYCPGL